MLVETATLTPEEVKGFINALPNGYTDVLALVHASEGYLLIVYKAV